MAGFFSFAIQMYLLISCKTAKLQLHWSQIVSLLSREKSQQVRQNNYCLQWVSIFHKKQNLIFCLCKKSHLHEKGGHKQCLGITGLTDFYKGIYILNCILKQKKDDRTFLSQIKIFFIFWKVLFVYIGSFCLSAISAVQAPAVVLSPFSKQVFMPFLHHLHGE